MENQVEIVMPEMATLAWEDTTRSEKDGHKLIFNVHYGQWTITCLGDLLAAERGETCVLSIAQVFGSDTVIFHAQDTRELVGRRAPYVTTDRKLMSRTVCLLGEVLSGIQRPRCPGH